MTSLRAWARWAGWGQLLTDYSAPTPPRAAPHPIPEGIAGVRRMIATARTDEQRALVALCGLCGLRVSEALSSVASEFNIQEMELTVRGKGDVTRRVPVSPEAWEILFPCVARSFTNANTPLISFKDRFARSLITSLAERAGLSRRVSSHDLRATFATEVYNKTLDQRLVQILLGHANGSTTEGYIGKTQAELRDGVRL